MVEELENEVSELVMVSSSSGEVKKIDELMKKLKDEREQREKLEDQKKQVEIQLEKLEAELKRNSNDTSNLLHSLKNKKKRKDFNRK